MGPVAGDVASDIIQNVASGIMQGVATDLAQDGNKDFVGELSVTLVDARKLSFVLFGKDSLLFLMFVLASVYLLRGDIQSISVERILYLIVSSKKVL